jgi:hypothetical protein
MTTNTGLAEPASMSADARQQARDARRRQHVVTVVMLVAAARAAVDRRTLVGVIVLAIGLVAVKRMATERGFPVLEWYRAQGRHESRSSA